MGKRTVKGAATVRWKVKDGTPGADAVYYEMKVMKGGSVIASISCDSMGKPKKVENVSAYIYRVVGRNKTLISNFYFKVDGLSDTGAVSEILVSQTSAASSCSFSCSTLGTRSYRIRVTEGAQGTGNVISEIIIPKNLDGVTGNSGYTYRPRGLFVSGNSYVYNDEYRDVIMKDFSGKVYMFRVRTKGTAVKVAPTSASGDTNWEVANDLGFVATDLLLSRKIIAEEIDGERLKVTNGVFDGNIYTPYKIINQSNFFNYTINSDSGNSYNSRLELERCGLNVQFDWWREITIVNGSSTHIYFSYLNLPNEDKYLGCELNLLNMTSNRVGIQYSYFSAFRDSITNEWVVSSTTSFLDFFESVKLKLVKMQANMWGSNSPMNVWVKIE